MVIHLLPELKIGGAKGRTSVIHLSCLSGSVTPLLSYRRSMTCGYENYVLWLRRFSIQDGVILTGV
jgi:hypothetical protein